MGRTRSFDEATVVSRAAEQFRSTGYEATSLDDLLRVTGLHRGSLYQAFGSKRGLFVAALRQSSDDESDVAALDLLLIALLELAPIDAQIRALAAERTTRVHDAARLLGQRLIDRAHVEPAVEPVVETSVDTIQEDE